MKYITYSGVALLVAMLGACSIYGHVSDNDRDYGHKGETIVQPSYSSGYPTPQTPSHGYGHHGHHGK